MRTIGRLIGQPMLHVQARLGAFEDNLSVHAQDMTPRRASWNYGCLRRSVAAAPPAGSRTPPRSAPAGRVASAWPARRCGPQGIGRDLAMRCEPMPCERIEPACRVRTISKVSPTWVASMAVRPASPSFRRVRRRASAMVTSWQSATPAKPIARRLRPNQNSALRTAGAPERRQRDAVSLEWQQELETEAGSCFGSVGTPPGR